MANVREFLGKLNDGFFRKAALREARARIVPPGEGRGRSLAQAKLVLETARRTAEPVEALPPGSRSALLIELYRDAAYWALAASHAGSGAVPPDLRSLWAETPADTLPAEFREDAARGAVESLLLEPSTGLTALEATTEDATRLGAFVSSLVTELDAPRQRADQILVQRWGRFAVMVGVLVLGGVGIRAALGGPNLIVDKQFRTSSTWAGCAADPPCMGLMFHTDHQHEPWVEFDLGAPKKFHRIEVSNRTDCCSERAIPLIAEIGNDRVHWTEVARRDTEFTSWTAKFPPKTARYVRLRVPRDTVLHFRDVAVR